MLTSSPRVYVTVALPYANGPLHLGHLVEMIEADIWVRSQRAQGKSVLFVSGNDAHGTPIMIHAQKQNIQPYDLVSSIHALHKEVIQTYGIDFDLYGRTDSELNKQWCYKIYETLSQAHIFKEQSIQQYFDEKANMFLPDRFIKGICPRCQSRDQNGDHCDACGATYDPTEMKEPYSILSGSCPVLRSVQHLFVDLEPYREWLKTYLPGKISAKIISKFNEWLDEPLRSWDITRDSPYYGVPIPDRDNQYFYVWFDAPIGYIALFDQISKMQGFSLEDFYHPESQLVHFIGKDISYFHGIFWPVILKAAGLPLPSKIHVHGFLTLNGQKMSKSRGIVCDPQEIALHISPDCMRYYLASKMHASIDDMNFDVAECVEKINSDLVGKSLNILSRCSKLLFEHFEGRFSSVDASSPLTPDLTEAIAALYEQRQYQGVVQILMQEMTALNEQLTVAAPWSALKKNPKNQNSWDILTQTLKAFQNLMKFMQPIVPTLSERIHTYYSLDGLTQPYSIILHRLSKESIIGALAMPTSPLDSDLPSSAAAPVQPHRNPMKPLIGIDEFSKIDLRIGRVVECYAVEKSEKLLAFKVDIGDKIIQIFSGIKAYVKPEDLLNINVVVCVNLAPRKMSVGLSEGMILSAHDGSILTPLTSLTSIAPGALIS